MGGVRGGGLCIKRVPRPPRNKKEPSMGSSFLVLLLGRSLLLRTGALATLASAGLVSLTVTFTGGTLNGSDWIHAMTAAATWLINSSTSTFGLWAKDSGNVCSANICSSLFVIVSFSPNRKLATPHRKRAYVRPRLKIATAATLVLEAQRHSGEADQPRSRPRRARTNANPSEHLTIAPAQKRY